MKRFSSGRFYTALVIVILSAVPAFSQFEQMRRARERMDQSIRADERRQREAEANGEFLPEPKPAVMNVDVQGIVAGSDYKSFADAKAAAIATVTDGMPVWLYLKFKTRLGDYVRAVRDETNPAKINYLLFVEVGPKDDVTALSQYVLAFSDEDLSLPELKINLAPGAPGRNASMPVFLSAAAAAKPGQWTNEIRVSNIQGFPRGPGDHLAKTPVTVDLTGSNAKYKKMADDYESMVLRGTTDLSVAPIAGTFFDAAVKNAVTAKLAAARITPRSVYFAGYNWSEAGSQGAANNRLRRAWAVYTFGKAPSCNYGIAEAVEKFDYSTNKFGAPEITLSRSFEMPCGK